MLKLIMSYLSVWQCKGKNFSDMSIIIDTLKNTNALYRYRYSLDRSSRKFICPQCGKRTFVRYWDNMLGGYMPDERVGKCDRSIKCNYHLPPRASRLSNARVPVERLPHLQVNPAADAPYALETDTGVFYRHHKESFFYRFLLTLPVETERIEETCRRYDIGSSRRGGVIFWQKDTENKIRSGKIMYYDPLSGKRLKTCSPEWVHKKVATPKGWQLRQCLFGLHLLKTEKTRRLAIVESEKTAVLLSLFCPERLWTACGGKMNLKAELLKEIDRNEIELYPDLDAVSYWQSLLPGLQKDSGRRLSIVPWWSIARERGLNVRKLAPNADAADLLLLSLKASPPSAEEQ